MYSYKLNWQRDPADPRDVPYRAKRPRKGARPRRVDLRPYCSPIENQGSLGSCTGHGTVGAMEWLLNKLGIPFVDLSRLFAYYIGRMPIFQTRVDSGAFIRDVIKMLAKYGVPLESSWAYVESRFADRPPNAVFREAACRKVTSYERLRGLDEILDCLAGPNGDDGMPVVFGFDVPSDFMSDAVAMTGLAPAITSKTQFVGGHCVLAVGYDEDEQVLIFRNSWGEQWGFGGYGRLPFSYVRSGHTDDHWCIQAQETPSGVVTQSTGFWNWVKSLFCVGLIGIAIGLVGCAHVTASGDWGKVSYWTVFQDRQIGPITIQGTNVLMSVQSVQANGISSNAADIAAAVTKAAVEAAK